MSVKKLLLISFVVIVALAVPLTIYLVQKQQEIKSHATASTTLSLTPNAITKNVGDTMTFDININPGNNLVDDVTLDISYDPTKIEPADGLNSLKLDGSIFPQISTVLIDAENGHIKVDGNMGFNTTISISKEEKIGTLTMKAKNPTDGSTTKLDFANPGTVVLSSAGSFTGSDLGSNDSANENVLQAGNPALVTILGAGTQPVATATIAPVNPTNTPNNNPTITPSPTHVPAPTLTPTVTPTVSPTSTQANTNTSTSPTVSPTTLLAQGPTGSNLNTSSQANESASPTLDATGPGITFVSIGAFVALLTVIGSILFFTL